MPVQVLTNNLCFASQLAPSELHCLFSSHPVLDAPQDMSESASSQLSSVSLSYLNGVLLVLLAGVFWSTMGLGVRYIEFANVWQILLYRSVSLATFLFVLISIRSGFRPFNTIRRVGIAGVIGGISLVFAFAGGIYAIQTTTVANAMFLFASAPFFAAILGWMILRESVRRSTWVATAVAMLGIGVMVIDGIAVGHIIGNLSALVSAFGFAVFTIALRWGKLEDMLPAVFLAGVFAVVVSSIICLIQGYSFSISTNDASIAVALGEIENE